MALSCSSQPKEWKSFAKQKHPWGYYSGPVDTRWDSDGRTMTLLNELRYTDPEGVIWIAPAGSKIDGASIPRSLWSFMGGPFEGKYRNASVLHDVSYDQHSKPPKECDLMFYNAMRCSGVGAVEAIDHVLLAATIWAALAVCGEERRARQSRGMRRRDGRVRSIPAMWTRSSNG